MARVLYVISRRNTFTAIDRAALEERHEVIEYFQPGVWPRPAELWRAIGRADVVVGWFASWHTLLAMELAKARKKPSLLIFGGFDTANMPEIDYGSQRGGVRRRLVHRTVGLATRLVTNSEYTLSEIRQNTRIDPARVRVVHHGIPDRFGDAAASAERERMALTVGAVYSVNMARKGHGPFLDAAAQLPDVEFVLAGEWWDETGPRLAESARPNVRITGRLPDEDLDALFRAAAVYVQPSLQEGFGMSLAEAMLAGAVPVVTRAGAMPEVVGDTGVVIPAATADAVAAGIREALALGPGAGQAARERVRTTFTYERRRDGILEELDRALAGERS
ncbi:MAG: glycosyltransferase family 4 protein [Actinomycetota bacterium]|nr:glycosyltransferase family 4 protein [Actinomycetota bacterium]